MITKSSYLSRDQHSHTDSYTIFSRYKPLIILESSTILVTRALLVWGNGVVAMQTMQIIYGVASASEVAYYSYSYAAVPQEHYHKVTAYTR